MGGHILLNDRRKHLLWAAGATVFGMLASLIASVFLFDRTVELIPAPNGAIGVTVHDADRADDGYVLVSPLNSGEVGDEGRGIAYLIDKTGAEVHRWETPQPLTYAVLLPGGDLLYMGVSDDNSRQMPGGGRAGGLYRLDWEGNVVWSYEDPYIHHDFDALPDGSVVVLRWAPLPEEFGARIDGGIPETEHEGAVWGDEIVRVSPDGEAEVVWRVQDHVSPEAYPLPNYLGRGEWTHANSLQYIEENPIDGRPAYLMSFRQISLVVMADASTGEVVWEYGGPGVLNQQHDPTLLENGNVLIFDNGQYRYDSISSSEVIEVDPRTNEVVWTYAGEGRWGWRLYSAIVSGAQRLSNGNTLITEGLPGRLLEVTEDGEIVWEYFHPYGGIDENSRYPENMLFKARSYPKELVAGLLGEDAPRTAR